MGPYVQLLLRLAFDLYEESQHADEKAATIDDEEEARRHIDAIRTKLKVLHDKYGG